MKDTVLFCTVGGSHQPILRAIEAVEPRYVCFFCTGKDPDSGKPGSEAQVIGKGKVIKASYDDDKPTLPNIPVQAGFADDMFEPMMVPADDLDGAWQVMRDAMDRLAGRFHGARLVADYTGGTKTMTAALVCAALERSDVDLQLVTGARANLVRVPDGTERAMPAGTARLRLAREMAPWLNAWRRFAYREASDGLRRIRVGADHPDRSDFDLALALSRGLSRWDDFDHGGALALVKPYQAAVAKRYPAILPTLHVLTHGDGPKRQPALLFDLWLNAERCAAQARYDDATARVYRLIEWTAQWQLRRRLDVETADFPPDRLPEGVTLQPDRDGKIRLGLWAAWQVVKLDADMAGPAQAFMTEHEGKLKDRLAVRNGSILAHGFEPVREADWQKMQQWMEQHFLQLLDKLGSEAGLKKRPEQLPQKFSDRARGPDTTVQSSRAPRSPKSSSAADSLRGGHST